MARITEKIRVRIDRDCPKNPFYVRWVNDFGFEDHWLFNRRQDYGLRTAHSGPYRPYSDDLSTTKASLRNLRTDANEIVTCYAEQLQLQEVLGLETLLHSPRVEWLKDVDNDTWVEVTPVTGSFSIYRTDQALHQITISFDLQPINIPTN